MRLGRAFLFAAILAVGGAHIAGAEWYTYTTDDGLANNLVVAIFEDRLGNLWFGTYGGVSCYDGVNCRSYWRTYESVYGVNDNWVSSIEEDLSGNLWFGSVGAGAIGAGVSCYDGVSWRTYTTADGLAFNRVSSIESDRSGNMWFGTDGGGVSRYDGTSWHTFTTDDGLGSNEVRTILEDHTGALWFGTNGGGVTRYDGVSWHTYTTADGLAHNSIWSIEEDHNGNLWFGTAGGGVSHYDGVSWRTYTAEDGLMSNYVTAILEDRFGTLWFGINDMGLIRYDGQSWQWYTTADGLASNDVRVIRQDVLGNLWVGTSAGVSRFDGVGWHSYDNWTTPGPGSAQVWPVFEESQGTLWFGTGFWGVTRYDGTTWRAFRTSDGLADDRVTSIGEDLAGNLWVGTWNGVSRYDGVSWRTYTTADGLPSNYVTAILGDRVGNLWVGTSAGVSRFDGVSWVTYATADGLVDNRVRAILEDRSGNLWFGTDGGVSRYDGVSWRAFTTVDGLAENFVWAIEEDHSGNLWFGTYQSGVSRYDGVSWRTFTTADGLASNPVYAIVEDRSGNLWFGTDGFGVSRYDGMNWGTYTTADGLAHNRVRAILEDRAGNLWFGTAGGGVSRHAPDLVPPQTAMSPQLPRLSTSTTQTIGFVGAFREAGGVGFSYSFDGSPWSGWSSVNFWQGANLSDGEHVFIVRSRDKIGNVDPTPAVCLFEIDASPPIPTIASPASGQAVRDSVAILGTASDMRFRQYRVDARALGTAKWDSLVESAVAVTDGVVCSWNTLPLRDGNYELRLSVADTLGLVGTALTRVIVDNRAPWANETAPATVSVTSGGHIYTTAGEVHLYFPPHAFARDTQVGIVALSDASVPDMLENGAARMLPGYEISWGDAVLEKAATLELSYAGWEPAPTGELTPLPRAAPAGGLTLSAMAASVEALTPPTTAEPVGALTTPTALATAGQALTPPAVAMPALYVSGGDGTWRRVGGTVDASSEHITAAITQPGRYALFLEQPGTGGSGAGTLSAISLTPRVFSSSGTFANDHVAIGFTLGRSAPVTVKIYNRAGRLVREVISGQTMGAGANLVRWDGRDGSGDVAPDGLYLVTVEAMGRREAKTISVVR